MLDPSNSSVSDVTGLVDYQHTRNNRLKAKLNQRLHLTFLLERRLNSQLTASLGAQIPLTHSGEGKRANKAGLKLAWNL